LLKIRMSINLENILSFVFEKQQLTAIANHIYYFSGAAKES
jgi:hypothetical protein